MGKAKKVILVIFDGWGIREERKDNAIACARTPNYTRLLAKYPNGRLEASGLPVGLPDGVMGNSEVGHMNIGGGRRVIQDQVRIHEAIESGAFFSNAALRKAMSEVKSKGARLHLLGLVSRGNVHSAERHYLSLIEMARKEGVEAGKLKFHAILDGRDTPPKSASEYLKTLCDSLQRFGGEVATISGRFYAMDRDKRWERTDEAYRALVLGDARRSIDPMEAIKEAYAAGETDEFVRPVVVTDTSGKPRGKIDSGDYVICFNFRPDRMRQIVRAFRNGGADVPSARSDLQVEVTTFTQYDKSFTCPMAFPPHDLKMCLGEVISLKGLSQFRTAETEKYAHVTYFFNGGRENPLEGEERLLIPSPKIRTYDLEPAMSSAEVTRAVVDRAMRGTDSLIVVNFAQPDMVGHTGHFEAAIEAVESGDKSLGEIVEVGFQNGYAVCMTADHGNVEMMRDPKTGEPHTAHTTNPVPFICATADIKSSGFRAQGALRDVAPTILTLLGFSVPKEMDGTSLLAHA